MIEIKHKYTGEVLHTVEGDTFCGADLCGANLNGADLRGANLSSAEMFADCDLASLIGVTLVEREVRGD